MSKEKRISRWYFGGLAGVCATCFTHPFDLIKVHLQTQQEKKTSFVKHALKVINEYGVLALYSGLSASIIRQMTYSTSRFGIYGVAKQTFTDPGFGTRVVIASTSGAIAGFVGTPADVVNVRMQNDSKLPPEQRRNYKNAVDGFIKVCKEEGAKRLFSGCTLACSRAALMNIGQLSAYDQIKMVLLGTNYFQDNVQTHFISSLVAGLTGITLAQPLDVLKTRAMNAKPGEFKSFWELIVYTSKLGPIGFYKGYVPAFARVGPHTILMYLFLEQFRLNFGFIPEQLR